MDNLNKKIYDSEFDAFSDAFWSGFKTKASVRRIPVHGHFELTPKCNFDCKMCYVHLQESQMIQEEIKLSKWKYIIDEAIKEGMVFASLSGGECLTVPFFDELYLYLKNKGILVFVLTNGFLLDEKIELFKNHPPAHIQVSVYGWDDESYQKVTGRKAYSKVINGILNAKNAGLSVSVAVTPSRYMTSVYKIVKKFYDLKIGVSVNKWLMPPYDSTGRCLDEINLSPSEKVVIEEELLKATDSMIENTCSLNLPECGSKNSEKHYGLTCSAGRTDFSINWKGEMSPCVSLPCITGNPLKESFNEAWKNTVKFADDFELPIECFGCKYKKICKPCPAYHLLSDVQGHCNKDICIETKLLVERGLKILPTN